MTRAGYDTRIEQVDALRGFALFGILLVNIHAFASPYYGISIADPVFNGGVDRLVMFNVALLFELKFYLLFSFLFGYSFTLQMRSADKAGEAFVPRMLRRQAGLWVIGAAHAVLLYQGDILTTYAVLGIALLMMRGMSDRSALILSASLIGIAALLWGGIALLGSADATPVDKSQSLAWARAVLEAYTGTPATVIVQHVDELGIVLATIISLQGPCAFAAFLGGMVAGRRMLFELPDLSSHLVRQLLPLGLAIGLPGAAFYAWSTTIGIGTWWELAGVAATVLTAPALTAAYVAMAMFAFQRIPQLTDLLAPAGRMALSNYLMQSLVCAMIFLAYGFRLMGQVSPLGTIAIAVMIFSAQIALSRWWMTDHAYGPVEWVLRALTIAGWPRWRRDGQAA